MSKEKRIRKQEIHLVKIGGQAKGEYVKSQRVYMTFAVVRENDNDDMEQAIENARMTYQTDLEKQVPDMTVGTWIVRREVIKADCIAISSSLLKGKDIKS
ncbi:MAG: hypothetical protein LBQ64_05790 [Bacteroidales bacterium]|jgi:hypothetical protein|nr:hypothetical protein [Bacteroidales bacterium]